MVMALPFYSINNLLNRGFLGDTRDYKRVCVVAAS